MTPTSTIALPTDFVANVLNFSQNLFTSWSGYITLIVGVILAALVLDIIIGALHRK